MKRPLADKRPFGPFAQLGRDDISEFDKIEVHPNEDTRYQVIGIFDPGPAERVGLVVDTNAIVINGETSFAIFDGEAGAEFTAAEGETVGIKEADRNLTNIIIPR